MSLWEIFYFIYFGSFKGYF